MSKRPHLRRVTLTILGKGCLGEILFSSLYMLALGDYFFFIVNIVLYNQVRVKLLYFK